MKRDDGIYRLSDAQRALVQQNIGLVRVDLRRFTRGGEPPRRDRETDDLFQEGLLGLMRAAALYDPQRHGAFAAFALPRIHGAISTAVHEHFATVRVPARLRRAAARRAAERSEDADAVMPTPPNVVGMGDTHDSFVAKASPPSERSDDPRLAPPATIGECLHERFVSALRDVSQAWPKSRRTGRDVTRLIRTLTNERLLIPDDEHRTPLRQIARDLDLSISTVRDCELPRPARIRPANRRRAAQAAARVVASRHPAPLSRARRRRAGTLDASAPATARHVAARMDGAHLDASVRRATSPRRHHHRRRKSPCRAHHCVNRNHTRRPASLGPPARSRGADRPTPKAKA